MAKKIAGDFQKARSAAHLILQQRHQAEFDALFIEARKAIWLGSGLKMEEMPSKGKGKGKSALSIALEKGRALLAAQKKG